MSPGRTIFAAKASLILLTLVAEPRVQAGVNDGEDAAVPVVSIANGGTIILHSIHEICSESCVFGSIILVAADGEIEAIHQLYEREAGLPITIKIQDNKRQGLYTARVQCTDDERLSGQLVATGEPVLVVSESYARRHGWM